MIKIKSLTKSEKIGLARKGNIEKYNSYSEAFKRIKESIKAGFYLEAITIEESIICDRLYSIYVTRGKKPKKEISKITVGDFVRFKDFGELISEAMKSEILKFWKYRCFLIHQICKSYPKTSTININSFLEDARNTSSLGFTLSNELSNICKNHYSNKKQLQN
jgi:hypothetical protein